MTHASCEIRSPGLAQPLSADQFPTALKRSGVRVVEHGNWRTHTTATTRAPGARSTA